MVAPVCPECGSQKLYKDGFRYLKDGTPIQRYVCRVCGYRFSNGHNNSKSRSYKKTSDAHGKVQLLMEALKDIKKNGTAGATQTADIKGKLVEFAWKLKREGISEATIHTYTKYLLLLRKKGANLLDPESVKDALAYSEWSNKTKSLACAAYQKFAVLNGLAWKPPKYKCSQKLPFIPLESEIDALISCCSRKISTILQLLKETGMRIGEALRLKWTDIDFERNIIMLNNTEKGGTPRIFKVSSKLVAMLKALPKKSEKVFKQATLSSLEACFSQQRKRAASKLQNPRLQRISFHTIRHWKATMEYHKTKDILHVMKLLGHRNIQNTLIYTQLVKFETENEYHSATAETVEEARKLIEAGFEYVCTKENVMLFRKRK